MSKDYYLKHLQTIFCCGELKLILAEHIVMAENKHGINSVSKKAALTILHEMLGVGSGVSNYSTFFLYL